MAEEYTQGSQAQPVVERPAKHCTHLGQIRADVQPYTPKEHPHVCPECVALGDTWVHLRECLVCGHVGCCDSSKNTHATKHFEQTKREQELGHAIMRSIEQGEAWRWCYIDQMMV